MSAEAKKIRPEKDAQVAELRERLAGGSFAFLADYKGLSVAKTTDLRGRLRKAGARIQVVPNRLFKVAARAAGQDALAAGKLTGPTALVVGTGDPVEVAKILVTFAREHERPKLKAGALDGRAVGPQDIEALSRLPPRPVLLAQMLGTLAAPMSGLVGVLQQKVASLVYVLKAAQGKKEQAAGAAPAA